MEKDETDDKNEKVTDACISCDKSTAHLRKKKVKQTRIVSEEQKKFYSKALPGKSVKIQSILCEKCRVKLKFRPKSLDSSNIKDSDGSQPKQPKLGDADKSKSRSNSAQTSNTSTHEPQKEIPEQQGEEGSPLSSTIVYQLRERIPPLQSTSSDDNDFLSFASSATNESEENLSEASLFPSPCKPKPVLPVEEVEMPFRRTVSSHAYCFLCGTKGILKVVPFDARIQVFTAKRVYIPSQNRCCESHLLKNKFYDDDLDKVTSFRATCSIPSDECAKFLDILSAKSNTSLFDQFQEYSISEERLHALTGFNWQNIIKMKDMLVSMRNTKQREIIQALIVFLFKLRTGNSGNVMAAILNIPDHQTVERYFDAILTAFRKDVLPKHFGPMTCDRDFLINQRTSPFAKELFNWNNELVLICDGTYVTHEKSGNNAYQRKSYSGQKKKHLCKPFTICTTDGYVVDVSGPYEGTKNDATILEEELLKPDGISKLLKKGDVFVLDRGFRDVVPTLEKSGYKVLMPSLKGPKAKQLTTEESNHSRYVTKVRWVVEAIHGIISQKYKFLHNQLDNKELPDVGDIARVVCCLNNIFGKKLICDVGRSEKILERMKANKNTKNVLASRIEDKNWLRLRRKEIFRSLQSTDLLDFPELNEEDLIILFTGTYQLGQAVSYLGELIGENDNHTGLQLQEVANISPERILKIEVKSRHKNRTSYKCFIEYLPNLNSLDGIKGYACECANGHRTVGACSHIAAIIFYLSNARFRSKIVYPNQILTNLFTTQRIENVIIDEDSADEDDPEDENSGEGDESTEDKVD